MNQSSQSTLDSYLSPATKRTRSNSSPELTVTPKKTKPFQEENMETATMANANYREDLLSSIGKLLDDKLDDRLKLLAKQENLNNVESKIGVFLEENAKIKEEIEDLRKENVLLKRKVQMLESISRRNNLIFKGVPNTYNKNVVEVVQEICQKTLGISEHLMISRAYFIGNKNNVNRPIKSEFVMGSQIDLIMKNVNKLKNTGIVVQMDESGEIRKIRSKFLAVRREINKTNREEMVKVKRDRLIVRKMEVFWSDEIGLISGNTDAVPVLQDTLNVELAYLVARLRSPSSPRPSPQKHEDHSEQVSSLKQTNNQE